MKFGFLKRLCIFLLPLLLVGCRTKTPKPYRVITQVRIVYENRNLRTQRDYYLEENIRPILDYLRYIDPYGIPKEDPELAQGRIYYITLIYSDGSTHFYEQRADQYLRMDGGDWKRIDPQRALYLSGLFSMMPGDEPPMDTEPIPSLIRPQI